MAMLFQFLAVVLWVISNGEILQNEGFDLRPNSFDVMLNCESLNRSEYLLIQSTNKYSSLILHNTTFLRKHYVDSPGSANLWYNIDAASKSFETNGTVSCKLCKVGKNINHPQTDYELEIEVSTKTLEIYISNSTVSKAPAFQTLNFSNPFQEMTKAFKVHSLHCAYMVPYGILPIFYPTFKFPKFIFENIIKIFPEKYSTAMTIDPDLHNSSVTIKAINLSNYDNSLETNALAEETSSFSSEDTARVNEGVLKPLITDNSFPYAQITASILLPDYITKATSLPIKVSETSSYSPYPSFISDYYGSSEKFSASISPSISYLTNSNEVTSATATPILYLSDNFDISSSSTYSSSGKTTFMDASSGEVRCADSSSNEASYIDSSSRESGYEDNSSSSRESSYEDNSSSSREGSYEHSNIRETSYENSNSDDTRYGDSSEDNGGNYGLSDSSKVYSSSSCLEDSFQELDSALIQSSSAIYFSSSAC